MEPTYQSPQFHGGDGIVTPSGSIETNLEGRCTLDEPVMETIMRDLRSIGTKLKYVMLPRARADKGAGLREWDLWGPLVLCLALGIMLSLHAEQALDLAELCGLLVALVSLFTDGRGGRSGQALRSHCLWRFSFDDALSLTDASARELANAAWACAKVTTAGLPCLERIATASLEMDPRPKFKGSFTAVDVAQLCWSLASLTVEVPWCRAAARWVTDQPATTAFPAQSVSTVAWALARGAAREGAKSEAAAAVELLLQGLEGDLEPRHWSNLSWAAAKVNAASLSPFLWHLPVEQLKQPQHLANVAWATAATAEISETADRLMPRIASQALQLGLHVFQDEELAGLLYGAASNHFVEERFLTEAQQEVASRCLGGVELAGIFWSLSVLSSASEPLRWEAANRAVELSPQGLANVAWACALQAWDAWATAGFLAAVKSHLKDFSPQGLVNLAWSWTEMEVHPGEEGALRKILLMAVERAEELKAMEFSSLLCSLAKSRRAEEAAALLRHLQRLEEFDARQVANCSWALALLQLKGAVAKRLAAAAVERMSECSAQGLSNLAWAFGCLEVEGPIFTMLAREAVGKMHDSTEQGLALLTWSFSKMSRLEDQLLPFLSALNSESQDRLQRMWESREEVWFLLPNWQVL